MNKLMLGMGVYSIPEAARLSGLHPNRLRVWFTGRNGGQAQKPFFQSDYTQRDGHLAISFRDLVDAYVVSKLRNDVGISLQSLRRIYHNLQKKSGNKHGFCYEKLLTDGISVYWHEPANERDKEILLDLRNRQLTIPPVLLPFMRHLVFDPKTLLASKWNIDRGVVIAPAINLGKPFVERCGISTDAIASAWSANDKNERLVALWYDITPEDVRTAVRFESRLAKGLRAA